MTRSRLILMCALALAAGCAKCSSGASGKNAEEFVSAQSTAVMSVPSLGNLADRLQALSGHLRNGPAGARLVATMAGISRQLGFDPFTKEGLAAAGLDPKGSLAAGFGEHGGTVILAALPVADLSKAEATVQRLAKDRAGAAVVETRDVNGQKVTALVPVAGATPEFAYTKKDGFLLLAFGQRALEVAAAATTREPEESIAKAQAFAPAKAKVGPRELYVMLPRSGSARLAMLPDSAVLGLGVGKDELAVRAYIALPPEHQAAAKEALAGGGKGLLSLLPESSPLYVRGGLGLSTMLARLEKSLHGQQVLARARTEALALGLNLDEELVGNIEPGFALSVGLSPRANLASAFDFDPRRSNPFDAYTLVGVGKVKDASKAKATLEKIPALAEKLGTAVEKKEADGLTIWTATYRHGDGLSWALAGDRLVVAGGLGDALAETIASVAKGTARVKPEALPQRARESLFRDEGIALALDFARIHEAVSTLPTSAFGPGAGGLMARSVATGMIAPLSKLRAVAAIAPTEGGLLVDVVGNSL